MTRQPALEKRITVAWPMPRLAPVRSSVRRGALVDDGIELFQAWASGVHPHLAPGLARRVAAEFHAVVQAERAVVPEFHAQRRDAPAAPARRPRHLADHMLGGDQRNRLLEGKAALQRLRLLARPGADLRLLWPCREIGVG